MKALRLAQWVLLALLALYLLLLHNANPNPIGLPFLPDAPAALVLLIGTLAAFAIGFLPTRLRLWRSERQLHKVSEERDALVAARERELTQKPVIPDRPEQSANRGDIEDPSDYL